MPLDKNVKILIVDDEPELREMLTEFLVVLGGQIASAENGLKGLEMIESFKPTVILSDINMPEMTGIKMLENIRMNGIDTPVIFLTAFADQEFLVKALRFGAFDFLNKPFDFKKLVSVVEEAAAYSRAVIDFETEWMIKNSADPEGANKAVYEAKKSIIKMRYLNRYDKGV
jgi:two-component system phosphate regulon sensor histidine kinase PhoR